MGLMAVPAGNCEFVYVGYVSSRNGEPISVCPPRTLLRGVLFDRRHL